MEALFVLETVESAIFWALEKRSKTVQDDVRALTRAGLPPRLAASAAPLRSGALGVAVGVVLAGTFALVTLAHLLILPPEAWHLDLLGEYFFGYRVSVGGVFIGPIWAFIVGFVAGWLLAAARNAALWLWLEIIRMKANLGRSDFLDGI